MSYIVLRGRWCIIIVLNAHAQTEEKSCDSKDSFYEDLEQDRKTLTSLNSKTNILNANEMLRWTFEPKRDEVTGELRILHNEELYALCTSPDFLIIRVIKLRKQRWVERVACMGWRRGIYIGLWWGDLWERVYLKDLGIDVWIILK
jgi:hypothetical protein